MLNLCNSSIVNNTAHTSFYMTKRYSDSEKHSKPTVICRNRTYFTRIGTYYRLIWFIYTVQKTIVK